MRMSWKDALRLQADPPRGSNVCLRGHGIGGALVLGLIVVTAFDTLSLPQSDANDAARAFWSRISEKPRTIGTGAHDTAADLLVSELRQAGLEIEEQKEIVAREFRPRSVVVAPIRNVVARLPGRDRSRAVLIASHYDTVPNSPGAGDSGIALAAMVAAARRLAAEPVPPSDVLFLFSDGEEAGLLGARAFVERHPWASLVQRVFNFDARGSRGPVLMFETGPRSSALVGMLDGRLVYTNSLLESLYSRLGYDTDFTVFKRRGIPGLNFGFVADWNAYHTSRDDTSRVDPSLIEVETSLMVALAQHEPEPARQDGDVVYLSVPGRSTLVYSLPLARGLAVVAGVLLVWSLLTYVMSGSGRFGILVAGVLTAAGSGLVAYVVGVATLIGLDNLLGEFLDARGGSLPLSGMALVGLTGLAVSVWLAALAWMGTAGSRRALQLGYAACWTVTAIVTTVVAPGSSVLFIWPALGACVSLFLSSGPRVGAARHGLALAAGSVGVLVVLPMAIVLGAGMDLSHVPVASTLVVMAVGFVTPTVPGFTLRWRRLPVYVAVASIVLLVAGLYAWSRASGYPRPSNLFLAVDLDARESFWASSDRDLDPWKSHYLTASAARRPLPEFFPASRRTFIVSPPSVLEEHAADPLSVRLETVGDGTPGRTGSRLTAMKIDSVGHRAVLYLRGPLERLEVAGRSFPPGGAAHGSPDSHWTVVLLGRAAQSCEIRLTTAAGSNPSGQVVTTIYGLPSPVRQFPRPPSLVSTSASSSDLTVVRRSLAF